MKVITFPIRLYYYTIYIYIILSNNFRISIHSQWDIIPTTVLKGRQLSIVAQAHQEKDAKAKDAEEVKPGAVPAYLLDREQVRRTKVPC